MCVMNGERPLHVHIRPSTVADAEMVAITHVTSWRAGYAGQLPDEYLAGLSVDSRTSSWKKVFAGSGIAGGTTLVALADGVLVGFASVGPSRDVDAVAGTGELWGLYTHPEVWGHGVGTALHSAALGELGSAGFSSATLWVLTSNARARSFYEGRGWRLEGQTKTDWRGEVRLDETRYERAELMGP